MVRTEDDGWRLARASIGGCAAVFVIGVLDQAGMTPCGLSFLGFIGLLVAVIAFVVTMPFRWRRAWMSSAFAIFVCLTVYPAVKLAAPLALKARFLWNKTEYEAVAVGIRNGTHPERLGPNERSLGYWVQAERFVSDRGESEPQTISEREPIVVVHFLAVSHGYAGHVGFARAFSHAADSFLRRGRGLSPWRYSEPLGDGWFLVVD